MDLKDFRFISYSRGSEIVCNQTEHQGDGVGHLLKILTG